MNVKTLLKSKIIQETQKIPDPNQMFTFGDIKIINENINLLDWNQEEKENLQKFLSRIKKYVKQNKEIKNSIGELLLENEREVYYELVNMRNKLIFSKFQAMARNVYDYISPFLRNFYNEFEHFLDDGYIEIEGILIQLEPLKHLKIKDLLNSYNVYDNNFHKDNKEIIYIYSCFDKITTLFRLFNSDNNKERNIYFSTHMSKTHIDDYPSAYAKLINETDDFINSDLFKDFKKVRNDIVHNHTMPMDEYFTSINVFIGHFLLIYYIAEVFMTEINKNRQF